KAGNIQLDRIGIAVSLAAKADGGLALAPAPFLGMLEAAPGETVDDAARHGDAALPDGRAVAVLDARAAPAQPDAPLRKAQFLLQVATPEHAVLIAGGDLVEAGIAQEAIGDGRRTRMGEGIANQMACAPRDAEAALPRRGEGMARPQRARHRGAA